MKEFAGWENKGFSFFQNKDCEYFPCHDVSETERFNCLFCFCPLYRRVDCGGEFTVTVMDVKDCSTCVFPHQRENYGYIIKELKNPDFCYPQTENDQK